jgi:EmrB/QacA subfamily drug resistance transporter
MNRTVTVNSVAGGTAVAPPRTAPPVAGSNPGAPRHARLALAAVCLAFFMILLDGSALNVALPAVQQDVHGSIAALQWVVNIYTIPLASVLLSAGSVGDRLGVRRLFVWSLALFTLASLLCALSPSLGLLVAARAVQGIAAGGMLPTTLAIIARTYPDPIERAKAITVWGATGGLALAAGPLVGGALTDLFGWRSIFLINVPVGLVTCYLGAKFVKETEVRQGKHFDVPGQITAVIALSGLVATLIEGGSKGWTSPMVLTMAVLTVLFAAAFVLIEQRSTQPMLPMAVFRRSAFTASVTNGFAFQFGGYGMQFMLAIYLQQHWHISAARTGLLFLPFGISWVFGTIVVNRRLVHRGPRWLLWTGALSALIGSLLVLPVTDRSSWLLFAVGTALVGLGCGVFSPSLNAAAMLSIDPDYAGLGSGVLNTARQVGMAIGVALLGSFIAMNNSILGLRIGMSLVAICFLAIIVLSIRYVPRKETG